MAAAAAAAEVAPKEKEREREKKSIYFIEDKAHAAGSSSGKYARRLLSLFILHPTLFLCNLPLLPCVHYRYAPSIACSRPAVVSLSLPFFKYIFFAGEDPSVTIAASTTCSIFCPEFLAGICPTKRGSRLRTKESVETFNEKKKIIVH